MNRRRPPLEPLDYAVLVVVSVLMAVSLGLGFIAGWLT
jgi:hypothetical protein